MLPTSLYCFDQFNGSLLIKGTHFFIIYCIHLFDSSITRSTSIHIHKHYILDHNVCILPWEGIKAVSFAGVGEGHTQAGHEGRVKDHCRALVPGRQVYRRHCPYTLTVQDDVFWGHSIPSEGKNKEKTAVNHHVSYQHFQAWFKPGILSSMWVKLRRNTNSLCCLL